MHKTSRGCVCVPDLDFIDEDEGEAGPCVVSHKMFAWIGAVVPDTYDD